MASVTEIFSCLFFKGRGRQVCDLRKQRRKLGGAGQRRPAQKLGVEPPYVVRPRVTRDRAMLQPLVLSLFLPPTGLADGFGVEESPTRLGEIHPIWFMVSWLLAKCPWANLVPPLP